MKREDLGSDEPNALKDLFVLGANLGGARGNTAAALSLLVGYLDKNPQPDNRADPIGYAVWRIIDEWRQHIELARPATERAGRAVAWVA